MNADKMVKFGAVMIFASLALTTYYRIINDNDHAVLLGIGSVLWIISTIIWMFNAKEDSK